MSGHRLQSCRWIPSHSLGLQPLRAAPSARCLPPTPNIPSAAASGSGFNTIPSPPPKGRSSTVRCRSCVNSRRSCRPTDTSPSACARRTPTCTLIQMSLVDTWAATGAGAFSLSENALYTVEAWQVFINRLSNDGILTISRWYDPTNLGETGRIVSLAVASLFRTGIQNPSRHIAMATAGKISTLLLSKRPFTDRDIAALKQVTSELRYSLVISPDELPHNAILGKIVSARSSQELQHAIMD